MPVHTVRKPRGATPLEVVEALKQSDPSLLSVPVGYAGRLDPMADGLLILLSGEDTKRRKEFEQLPKSYLCEAVFGFRTDSYDVIGIPEAVAVAEIPDAASIRSALLQYRGTFLQAYPPYSSARVHGRPLFWWARAGRLNEIEVPRKKVTVQSLELEALFTITAADYLRLVLDTISLVSGDFRQERTAAGWRALLAGSTRDITIARFSVDCSSGTYIRSIVHEIGRHSGCGAVASRITRTRIGPYLLEAATEVPFLTSMRK